MIAQAPRETAKGDDSLERCMVPRDCEATSSRGKPQQVAPGVQTCRSTTRIACVKQGARQPSRPCAGEVGKVRTGTRWEVVGVERWNCKGLGGTGFPPHSPSWCGHAPAAKGCVVGDGPAQPCAQWV